MRKIAKKHHALERYCQRIKGSLNEADKNIERALDSPRLRSAMDLLGDTPYKVKREGTTYIFKDQTLITCYATKSSS